MRLYGFLLGIVLSTLRILTAPVTLFFIIWIFCITKLKVKGMEVCETLTVRGERRCGGSRCEMWEENCYQRWCSQPMNIISNSNKNSRLLKFVCKCVTTNLYVCVCVCVRTGMLKFCIKINWNIILKWKKFHRHWISHIITSTFCFIGTKFLNAACGRSFLVEIVT